MDSARAALVEMPQERFAFVDGAWRTMRNDRWKAQRKSEVIMGLVTSPRLTYDN